MKPEIIVLHRYWMWANRMREHFFAALARKGDAELDESAAWFADDIGIFMSYWYSGLFVVVEGWKELGLSDPSIDPLLESPHIEELRRYRNGVCHFQKKYLDDRFNEICRDSQSSVPWVRELSKAFGEYFLRTLGNHNRESREESS